MMENIFYQRNITRTFDLKGSSRARYVELVGTKLDSVDELVTKRRRARRHLKFRTSTFDGDGSNRDSNLFTQPEAEHLRATLDHIQRIPQVLLDDNFMEQTRGRPFPLKHRAKMFFHKAVQNDTLFLSIVNVVDYSILVGFDDKTHEVTVGIIDYLRQVNEEFVQYVCVECIHVNLYGAFYM
ncbi:hypothetical protein EON65_02430 [archaeon]|nr:MAG: hypothetical protein EON65_02430 [archaeon]